MDNNQRDESLVLSRDAYAAQQAQTYRPSKPSAGFGHTWSKSLGIIGYILGGIYMVVSTIARVILRAAYVILKLVYGFVAMFFGDIFAIFVVALLIGLVIGAITGNPFYKL